METKKIEKSFNILNVKYDASIDEIKKAYHKLAKQYHPDKITNLDKKEAEKKFKLIKESYDEIIEFKNNNNFEYFNYKEETINDDFSNFFHENNKMNQNPTNEFNQKTKNKEFVSSRDKAIHDFSNYIQDNKISILHVYDCIIKKKPIYKNKIGYESQKMIFQETIYRVQVEKSVDFINFKTHYKLINNMDINVTLYFDHKHLNKNLETQLEYESIIICTNCSGWGCASCQKGITKKINKISIKIPKCINDEKITILRKGNISKWKKGNINITLKENIKEENNSKSGYYFVINKKNKINNESIKKAIMNAKKYHDVVNDYLKIVIDFLIQHKTHAIYISLITILFIIIIILAVVL